MLFGDCLGREIKVGDVVCNGHRAGDRGGITVGVVTGFTDQSICLDAAGKVFEKKEDGTWLNRWKFVKRHVTKSSRCFVTGMTREELQERINDADFLEQV